MKHNPDEMPCSIGRMLGCIVYDTMVLAAILFAVTTITLALRGGSSIASGNLAYQLFLVMCTWLYFAYSWRTGGQTLGMRAWQVHIRSRQAEVSWLQSLIRFAVAGMSLACFGLGYFSALLHPGGMTWHDLASGTWLVCSKQTRNRNSD